MSKNIKITKGIGPTLGLPKYIKFAKSNSAFCTMLMNKAPMPITVDDESQIDIKRSLIYNISKKDTLTQSTLQGIIDLLTQLRAAQSDQNVFIQNNTVVREQILNQLKNELLNVKNNLSQGQVQKLELVSNNLFDEKTLNEILKSLLEESKKKSELEKGVKSRHKAVTEEEHVNVVSNVFGKYNNFINLENKYKNIVKTITTGEILERSFREKQFINLKKSLNVFPLEPLKGEETYRGRDRIKETLDRTVEQRHISRPAQIIKRDLREKKIISRYTDLFKVKSAVLSIQKNLKSRNLSYLIHEYGRKRYEKLIKDSETRSLINFSKTELQFLKIKNVKENEEQQESTVFRDSELRKRVKKPKIKKEQNIELTDTFLERISEKLLINKNIFVNRGIIFSKDINEKEKKRLFLKSDFITYHTKIAEKAEQRYLQTEKLSNLFSYMVSTSKIKNRLINSVKSKGIKVKKSEIQNEIVNKYTGQTRSLYEETSLNRVISDVNLVNKIVQKNINLQDTENQVKETYNREFRKEFEKAVRNEISKRYNDEVIIKNTSKIYNESFNRYKKAVSRVERIYQRNKEINVTDVLHNELLLNKRLNERKNLLKEITKRSIKEHEITKQRNILDKTQLVLKKETLFSQQDNDVNILNKTKILSNLKKVFLNKLNTETKERKNILLRTQKLYKDKISKVTERQLITKSATDIFRDEKFTNINVEKSKTILAKMHPVINRNEIDLLIKMASQDIINRTVSAPKISHIKKSVINEKIISDIKNQSERLMESPLIIKEKIRNTEKIENNIYKKVSSFLPARIRELNKTLIKEKSLYREAENSQRLYFNNLRENIEERILLNRQKIASVENVHREIERDEVIYKKPISLEKIGEKLWEENREQQKLYESPSFGKRTKSTSKNYVPETRKEAIQTKEKGLTKDEVMKMIQSYMGDIDFDLMSDKIMERVEEEMLSQRRRSGII